MSDFTRILRKVERQPSSPEPDALLHELFELAAREQDRTANSLLMKSLVLRYADAEARISRFAKELEEKQERLAQDLRSATTIQAALLPKPVDRPGVRMAWRFEPCDAVGGDILIVHPIGENHLAVALIDVSGHGVPAAMVTVSVTQLLQPHMGIVARVGRDGRPAPTPPVEVLRALNEEYPIARFRRFFSIIYGLLDLTSGRFTYGIGGHPGPLRIDTAGRVTPLPGDGPLPGIGFEDFSEQAVDLVRGERVILFTDGVYECENPANVPFAEERFAAALETRSGQELAAQLDGVITETKAFIAPARFQDDYTLLAFEYAGPPGAP